MVAMGNQGRERYIYVCVHVGGYVQFVFLRKVKEFVIVCTLTEHVHFTNSIAIRLDYMNNLCYHSAPLTYTRFHVCHLFKDVRHLRHVITGAVAIINIA